MFKRIILEDWSIALSVIAFFFTASVFIYTSIRAIMLSKPRRDELAKLPLDD